MNTQIPPPQPGEHLVFAVQPGQPIQLLFDHETAAFDQVDGNLLITFEEGRGTVTVTGYFLIQDESQIPDIILTDGTTVAGADFKLAIAPDSYLEPQSACATPAMGEIIHINDVLTAENNEHALPIPPSDPSGPSAQAVAAPPTSSLEHATCHASVQDSENAMLLLIQRGVDV